jgi:hypothetical protein
MVGNVIRQCHLTRLDPKTLTTKATKGTRSTQRFSLCPSCPLCELCGLPDLHLGATKMSSNTTLIIANILFGVAILLILIGVIYYRLNPSANPHSFSSEELASSLKTELKCPKCNGEMEVGYIPDYFHGGSEASIKPSLWVEGYPEKHWFGGLKVKSKKRRLFLTYCCPVCGYIESYAIGKREISS